MEDDSLRSGPALERYYADLDKRGEKRTLEHLAQETTWAGQHWYIARNEYPYDMIAEIHHLLIPFRVFSDAEKMTLEELGELNEIKQKIGHDYDCIIENTRRRRSVAAHYHLHLIKYKNITDYHG